MLNIKIGNLGWSTRNGMVKNGSRSNLVSATPIRCGVLCHLMLIHYLDLMGNLNMMNGHNKLGPSRIGIIKVINGFSHARSPLLSISSALKTARTAIASSTPRAVTGLMLLLSSRRVVTVLLPNSSAVFSLVEQWQPVSVGSSIQDAGIYSLQDRPDLYTLR